MREQLRKGPVVLYEQMRIQILALIQELGLKPHDPVPSEVELAKMFGVSSRTSKEALLQLAQEGIVYRMPRRGTFLARLPGESDQAEAGSSAVRPANRRRAVGVLIPDPDEYVGRVLQSMTEGLAGSGFEVLVRFTSGLPEQEEALARELIDVYRVEGLIVYPGRHETMCESIIGLHTKRYPVVIVDRAFRELHLPSVYHDHRVGAMELTAYLMSRGHRRIGFVSEEFSGMMSREDRFSGYVQAFLDASCNLDLGLVLKLESQRGVSHEDKAQLDRFIANNRDMTAIVCSNDYIALSVMQSAYRLAVAVPDALSVVGFTDFSFAELLPVPLTTIEKPAAELGAAAAAMLTELMADPASRPSPRIIPTQLKERSSVKSI